MPISGQIASCYFTTVSLGTAGVSGAVGQEIKPAKCHLRQYVHSMHAPLLLSHYYSTIIIREQI